MLPAQEKEKLQVAEAEKSGTAKQEIKIIGKDILPIHTLPPKAKLLSSIWSY